MSCKSGFSTEARGFPSKCHCGRDVVIHTSTTKCNPGRPFFRCPTKRDDHLFKWVENGVYEEVVDGLSRFVVIDREIENAKSEVILEIEDLKKMIGVLKEDGMCSKKEIYKWKVITKLCLVCLGFTVIAFLILMLSEMKKQKLDLGY